MEDTQDYGRAIKVTMLMFGPLAEKMGTREIEVNMPDGIVESNTSRELHDSAEVAFLPPVSGG